MKTKSLWCLIATMALLCAKVNAQDKRTDEFGVEKRINAFEISADYNMPEGTFADIYKNSGFGVNAGYRYGLTQDLSLISSIGYMNFTTTVFNGRNMPDVDLSAHLIPVKGGLKMNFVKFLYAAAEVGFTFKAGLKGEENINSLLGDRYHLNGFMFNWAPRVGVNVPVKGKNYVDLSIRYEGMSNTPDVYSFTSVRLLFGFNSPR